MRHAADASLVFGTLGAFGAAVTGLSDWRYLSGGSRRMGVAHGLLNTIGLVLSIVSLVLEGYGAQKRRTPDLSDRILHQRHGRPPRWRTLLPLRAARRQERLRGGRPRRVFPVLDEGELAQDELRRVEVEGVGVLLSRSSDGEVCAIAPPATTSAARWRQGKREGDTVVCPLHGSRFDLCSGEVIDGPAVFPQSRYETRVRDGKIEVKAAAENIQKKVR